MGGSAVTSVGQLVVGCGELDLQGRSGSLVLRGVAEEDAHVRAMAVVGPAVPCYNGIEAEQHYAKRID